MIKIDNSNANVGAQAFGCAAFQERLTIHWGRDFELPAQCRDPFRIDFGLVSWEPASITEEGPQDGEAEPRFTALGHNQGAIGWRQSHGSSALPTPFVLPRRRKSRLNGALADPSEYSALSFGQRIRWEIR
jgi:hypothetical protein